MDIKIKINCDNDAFGEYSGPEVARILRNLAYKAEEIGDVSNLDALDGIVVKDRNGNTVGNVEVSE